MIPKYHKHEGYKLSDHGVDCYKQVVFHNHEAKEGCVVFVSNCIMMPDGMLHPHVHEDMDEVFIFESESMLFTRGTRHSLSNPDDEPLYFVCIGIRRAVG